MESLNPKTLALATAGMAMTSGSPVPWLVAAAGLADGFNPCSFAGLLVFASFTTAAFQRGALSCHSPDPGGEPQVQRGRLVRNGSVYISALFLTYLALGLGFVGLARWLGEGHWAGKLAAFGSLAMGLWVLKDYFFPDSRWRLELPKSLHPQVRQFLRATEVPSVFVAGVVVGLCTVPCTGGIYLGVLGLLASTVSYREGLGLLILYNAMFVLPLVVVLALSTSRRTYRAIARWHLRAKGALKLSLAAVMIALGFLTIVLLT